MTTRSDVILFGVGSSFLADVEATLDRLELRVRAYIRNIDAAPALDRDTIGVEEITDELVRLPCIMPLMTPGYRFDIVEALDTIGIFDRPPLVDPSATVAASAVIAEGVYVNAGSIVGGEVRLERFCLVNRASSIGHHSILGAFSTVGPGVTIPASVRIESGAFIGTGAVLLPGITVGRNAIVGAGAVVVRDVEANTVIAGNPARVIRRDIVGYNDVGVP